MGALWCTGRVFTGHLWVTGEFLIRFSNQLISSYLLLRYLTKIKPPD